MNFNLHKHLPWPLSLLINSQHATTFPLRVIHCERQRIPNTTWARQLLSGPIRWKCCSANFIGAVLSLITSLTLISASLQGRVGGREVTA